MAGPLDGTEEMALWRRFRSAPRQEAAPGAEPDALLLAAYAEGRLPPEQFDAVEDWLATHPDAIGDVIAARRTSETDLPAASDAILERASALVAEGDARILAFPARPPARRWQVMVTWGAMAASLLVTSLVGFALGNDAYTTLVGAPTSVVSQDLLDPPAGLFPSFDEDERT